MEWEGRFNTGKTCNKMYFEGVYDFFSRVCAVVVWRGELVVDFIEFKEGLETCWAFIVCYLEHGFEPAV